MEVVENNACAAQVAHGVSSQHMLWYDVCSMVLLERLRLATGYHREGYLKATLERESGNCCNGEIPPIFSTNSDEQSQQMRVSFSTQIGNEGCYLCLLLVLRFTYSLWMIT
eukprot:scaffold9582_cov132-Skeletonema_menzelii.AAC.2